MNNNYRYKNLAFVEWRDLYNAGKLTGAAKQFFDSKPSEMLFDCETDPHQIKNLANDPKYAKVLRELRERLQQTVKGLPDLSFYPESYLAENAMQNPVAFGQQHKQEIAELVDIADLSLVPFKQAKPALLAAIASDDPMKRYWAAMTCTAFAADAAEIAANVKPLLKDEVLIVRMRAAEFLGRIGEINPQDTLAQIVNTTQNSVEATEALNSVVWFKDFFNGEYPVKRSDFNPVSNGADVDDRLNYINGIPYPPKAGKGNGRKKRTAKNKNK